MRETLEDWIPKILAAQHPDGYLQTAFTLRDMAPASGYPAASRAPWTARWSPAARANHEGYVAGYFIESAINHYMMTRGPRPAAVRRGEAARGLLGGSHRPAAEAGVVRRPPGDGAGARALRAVRQRGGEAARRGQRPGRPLRRAREVPARLPQGRLRVRPEPPAGAAAVRGGGPRGPRGLHLLGHGRRRGRDPRRRLPERRQVALGQHRPQEVLPHRAASAAARRPKGSGRTTRCATTPTARPARAAARSSSSGSCTWRITTRSTPTSTSRRSTTRCSARWTSTARTSTTPTRSTRTSSARRGTTARAASATSRGRC